MAPRSPLGLASHARPTGRRAASPRGRAPRPHRSQPTRPAPPRQGASLAIGLRVSCSADRQALGKITRDGVYLEQLEANPAQYLPEIDEGALGGEVVAIDLNRPMAEILETLNRHPIRTRLS